MGLRPPLLHVGIIVSFQLLGSHLWLQLAGPRMSKSPGQKASSHTSFSFIKPSAYINYIKLQWTLPIPLQPNTINQCVLTPLSGYVRIVMQWGQRLGERLCLRGRMGLLRCVLRGLGRLGRKALARGMYSGGFSGLLSGILADGAGMVPQYGNDHGLPSTQSPLFFSRMAGYVLYLCHTT